MMLSALGHMISIAKSETKVATVIGAAMTAREFEIVIGDHEAGVAVDEGRRMSGREIVTVRGIGRGRRTEIVIGIVIGTGRGRGVAVLMVVARGRRRVVGSEAGLGAEIGTGRGAEIGVEIVTESESGAEVGRGTGIEGARGGTEGA